MLGLTLSSVCFHQACRRKNTLTLKGKKKSSSDVEIMNACGDWLGAPGTSSQLEQHSMLPPVFTVCVRVYARACPCSYRLSTALVHVFVEVCKCREHRPGLPRRSSLRASLSYSLSPYSGARSSHHNVLFTCPDSALFPAERHTPVTLPGTVEHQVQPLRPHSRQMQSAAERSFSERTHVALQHAFRRRERYSGRHCVRIRGATAIRQAHENSR